MEHILFDELDPDKLKIDSVNERVSNVSPHSEEGESLEDSIRRQGVIEAIVVREVGDEYHVVAGQRRTLAAQRVGEDTIPARVMDMTDEEARIVSITENADQFKKDVPKEDRAEAIKKLTEGGLSTSEISERMGFTEQTIKRWLEPALSYWEDTIFEADTDSKNEDESGLEDISLTTMQIIRKNTQTKEQREEIAKKILENNVKVELVRQADNKSNTPAEFTAELDNIISDLNSDVAKIAEKVRLTGESARKIKKIAKNRGKNEKEVLNSLIKERINVLKKKSNGEYIGMSVDEEVTRALDEFISDRDVEVEELAKETMLKKLSDTGIFERDGGTD